jgi:hypothetical protein
MPKRLILVALAAGWAAAGCGSDPMSGPTSAAVPAIGELHGGVLVPLADGQGYVELLNGERRGRTNQTTIVAYLLQADQKTASAQKPSEVVVKLGSQTVPLHAEPAAGEPAGNARYVSAPGPYDLHQQGGDVVVTHDGQTASGSFRGPR